MFFKIKSLKQLILLSFTFVLIPLVVLLWQSNSMLSKMAESAASEPIYALSLARNINVLEGLMIDIERVTKQFQIIKNKETNELVKSYSLRYREATKQLCSQIQAPKLCIDNQQGLDQVNNAYTIDKPQLDIALAKLRNVLTELKIATSQQLDLRLSQQQLEIQQVKVKQVWFTAALISTSLLFAMLSSNKILAPVQKLETLIKELADKKHKLSAVSSSGPSELIELENKLHQLAKRLNQLENLRKAMLRHAAHELKTPLASIKEGCLLLSDQVLGELNTEQLEVLSLLNSSGQRLEKLIEQLLDYNTLLQHSQAKLNYFNSNSFIRDFITDNKLALQHNNHLQLDIKVKDLYADEILFRRILDNLLSNAIAHGTPNETIFLRLYQHQGKQILEFANNGKTIDKKDREGYFKPFQRGTNKRHDKVSGSGLGLSIVCECASLMQGEAGFIDVEYADVCVQVITHLPKENT